ncbi:hypothetical protein Q9L58_010450 [Maublancomyces gigas]|uniref:Uncharacterized protein n=1 Tax=Discina gigas TaxID=1032678 RepID=A0ABR3G4N9_9PEZI
MRNLGKFLLRALTAALKNPSPSERLPFKRALHYTEALVDFQLVTQYLSHTETTLSYMASYLAKFEKYRDVFLEFRITKIGKARALRATQVLRQHQNFVSATSQRLPPSKKRKREVEDKLERDEEMQHVLRNDSHFNFIKMHLLTHFAANIKKFGNIPMWSMEIGDTSHEEIIKDIGAPII